MPSGPRQRGRTVRHLYILVSAGAVALMLALAAFGSAEAQASKDKPSNRERLEDLRQEAASMREDVEDLYEPVEEFDLFDQCMFTIGVTQYGMPDGSCGYVYGKDGEQRRQRLAIDVHGFDRPQYDLMAFPGEEPPQIECNEDAGGQGTDE